MISYEILLAKSLRFLSFRPRSEKEIRDYLKKQKAPEIEIEKIIMLLRGKKIIDDLVFAKWWIEQRLLLKPQAKRILQLELKQKGITEEIITKTVIDIGLTEASDKEQLQALITKRIGRFQNATQEEIYRKLGGYLMRRGYNFSLVKRYIDEALKKGV